MASVVYISQHKQLRAAAFVPLLFILFLFWQLRHNAGVALAPTGRVCAVCRQDVARLQERKVTKWKTIVLSARRDAVRDSKEDELIFISDKSLLCIETVLYANYLIYLQILSIFHVITHDTDSGVTPVWRRNAEC